MGSPYLLWLELFMLLPLAVIWALYFDVLWRYKRTILFISGLSLAIGIPWDLLAAKMQLWGWAEGCCSLPRVQGIPLEEGVFMLGVGLFVASLTIVAASKKRGLK